jgi:hypothetical protein
VVKASEAGQVSHDNEGRSSRPVSSTEESLVAGEREKSDYRGGKRREENTEENDDVLAGDVEADDEEGGEVDESDTPESSLDGGGEGLARVGSLGGGETDELSTGEREGGCYEDCTHSFEAVCERSWIPEIFSADVRRVGTFSAAAVENDADDDEDDDDREFEARRPLWERKRLEMRRWRKGSNDAQIPPQRNREFRRRSQR